jgi:hypothetical protein
MTGRDQTLLDQEIVVARLNRTMIGWANYFCLGPVSTAYRAVEQHARKRLLQWLCAKHKLVWPAAKRFPEASLHEVLGLACLTKRTSNLPWATQCLQRGGKPCLQKATSVVVCKSACLLRIIGKSWTCVQAAYMRRHKRVRRGVSPPGSLASHPLQVLGVCASAPSRHSREHHSPGSFLRVKRTQPNTCPHLSQASLTQIPYRSRISACCSADSFIRFSNPCLFYGLRGMTTALGTIERVLEHLSTKTEVFCAVIQ